MTTKLTPEQQREYDEYVFKEKQKQEAAARPMQLSDDQVKEYLDYYKANYKQPLSDDDWKAFEGAFRDKHQQEKLGDKAKRVGSAALDGLMRGLDYAGGIVRTGVATALDPLTDQDVVKEGDWGNALAGKAPSSQDYLERAIPGKDISLSEVIPSMYSETGDGWLTLKRGGSLDPTAKGTAGFVLDTALDPTTYLGGAATKKIAQGAAAALKTAARGGRAAELAAKPFVRLGQLGLNTVAGAPLAGMFEDGGKKLYKSGFTNIDAEAKRYGKAPVSDMLLEEGIYGSNRQIAEQSVDLARKLEHEREAILKQIDAKGIKPDMKAAVDPAAQFIYKNTDPNFIKNTRPELENFLGEYVRSPAKGAEELTQWKTGLNNRVGKEGFQAFKQTPEGKKFLKSIAHGFKEEVESMGRRAGNGLGERVADINDRWGRLLSTAKIMDKEALKGERKHFMTSVDPIVAAIGFVNQNPIVAAGTLTAKKAADLSKTTWGRTNLGYLMNRAGRGKKGLAINAAAKRGAIDGYRGSTWDFMGDQSIRELLGTEE